VIEAVADEVSRANARLSSAEQIKRFALIADEWLPVDELTPTMKLKRRQIARKYAATIAALYDGSEGFVIHYGPFGTRGSLSTTDLKPPSGPVIGSAQDPQHGR
jgi:hypothetical protein